MNYLAVFLLVVLILEVSHCKPAKQHKKHFKKIPLTRNIGDYIQRASKKHIPEDIESDIEKTEDSKVSKILGGEIAEDGQFPFIVSLEYDGNHFCGGSAISEHWVLTAAHCYDEDFQLSDINVRAGSLLSEEGGKLFDVEDFIIHSEYGKGATFANDIALIRVAQSLDSASDLKFIELPEFGDEVGDSETLVAAGWGITTADPWGPVSKELRFVNLKTLNNDDCDNSPAFRRLRRHYSEDLRVTKDMLCTATETKDTCKGDSGGPLVKLNGEKAIQIGVVSWGEGGGEAESPGVYTKVSHYTDWIMQHTELSP